MCAALCVGGPTVAIAFHDVVWTASAAAVDIGQATSDAVTPTPMQQVVSEYYYNDVLMLLCYELMSLITYIEKQLNHGLLGVCHCIP